jgi:hypothetical protein
MPDDGTWSDRNRPADPDQYPEDKFEHTFVDYEVPFPHVPEIDEADCDWQIRYAAALVDTDPETYAEAIGLDDYDLDGDR